MALSRNELRTFYDRFGARQDRQGWYEDEPLAALVAHAGFDEARQVLEVGCGTGRLAADLLARHLPSDARYLGLDISQTMVDLSRQRLAPWAGRAEVRLSEGGFDWPVADRLLSTYMLDLLSETEIDAFIAAARRSLGDGGRLCLVYLAADAGPINAAWNWLYRLAPRSVGGCHPVRIVPRLQENGWHLLHRQRISCYGICSEVVVAEPGT
ncbi:MAG: class I SAM-dependent methyltransferase [Alphaproteobacteria bacterium]|jgi:cyclopropane fatty-acyl-phospholipid synthase-like methyltransferase|nr:class I SAM-dependent methyltransferase [Alphaproteobacteria bacterium]MDP6811732.1 class I SAM-dependent methyltransferase [Alphaproteobacteria bacterium]